MVVQLWTDQEQRLSPGSSLASARGTLRVVADREAAERLRGVELEAEAIDAPGTLWVHELVGAAVRDAAGTELGLIAAVEANPASDLLVLESGVLIPLRFVTHHDASARTVEVDLPEGLLEL